MRRLTQVHPDVPDRYDRLDPRSFGGRDRAASRQKMITVLVIEDKFAGALAYALQRTLDEPAKIRVLRVGQPRGDHQDVGLPLPVSTLTAEELDPWLGQSAAHDVIVVESPRHLEEAPTNSLLAHLRHARCLVVQVDDGGQVIGASGPEGWSYSATGGTAAAGRSDDGIDSDVGGTSPPLRKAHADGPSRMTP